MGRVLPLFVALILCFGHCHASEARVKAWWAKKINDDFSTAGRPTNRQIKYAAESGEFKSILSIFFFAEADRAFCNDTNCDDYLPDTSDYVSISNVAGIEYRHLPRNISWSSVEAVDAFEAAVDELPKPILVHCDAALAATGVTLLYLAKRNEIACSDVFSRGLEIGFDYRGVREFVQTARSVVVDSATCPDVPAVSEPLSWKRFWEAKRLTDCVYISAQFQTDHVCNIQKDEFKVVANMRMGAFDPCGNAPSQEEVSLLNVNSSALRTYDNGGRQLTENLMNFRLDPTKPNSYISPDSTVNFESKNTCEFGDDVGYNETLERLRLDESGIKYCHVPVGGCYRYDEDAVDSYYCLLREVFEETCPLLFHCKSGFRGAYFAVLFMAITQNRSCEWALEAALRIGYDYSRLPLCRVISTYVTGERQLPVCTRRHECVYGPWSAWSPCSRSCDLGIQKRTRKVLGSCTGSCKKPLLETSRICQHRPCSFEAPRRVKPGRCRSFRLSNVTYDKEAIRGLLGCEAAEPSGEDIIQLPSQVWCVKSSGYEGDCAPIKAKSFRFEIGCPSRKNVWVSVNKRCGG